MNRSIIVSLIKDLFDDARAYIDQGERETAERRLADARELLTDLTERGARGLTIEDLAETLEVQTRQAQAIGRIEVEGRTLSVCPDAPHDIDPRPGQILLTRGKTFPRSVRTDGEIVGKFHTPEGIYSQIHRHYRDGRFYVYGWVAPRLHPDDRERYATPEEAVTAALADYYSGRYEPQR